MEEIDKERVRSIRLLSGPANANEKAVRLFARFVDEMRAVGIECDWRVLPAERGRDLHARVLFDDSSAWETSAAEIAACRDRRFHPPVADATSAVRAAWSEPDASPIGAGQTA